MTRRKLIAGNWKMHCLKKDGVTLASDIARFYAGSDQKAEVLVCPSFTILYSVANAVSDTGLLIGAQDCHYLDAGAHTGDVSPLQLKDLACSYVILGHSERRQNHKETDALIQKKAEQAIKNGLKVILCVGETEAERMENRTDDVIKSQLLASIPAKAKSDHLVIAYEPVWAIGTGKTATPEEAQAVHAMIRKEVSKILGSKEAGAMRILYGGSVKPSNAKELLDLPDVDGALVGGAALKAEDFCAIIEAAN